MNSDFYPDNVNYGYPNSAPSNPTGTQALNIPQMPTQQQPQQQQQKQSQNYFIKIMSILNNKTGTILTTAIGLAIGFSFKDLIASGVSNVLQPLFIMLLSSSAYFTNLFNLTSLVGQQSATLNIIAFISSCVSFIFTIITVYYVSFLISAI
jgi:large-conductance mechanosensitive channel